ncbi:hypothetical protein BBJ29_000477 [Phytophthora kernoviae]|uniref:RING-type domain-containing protein n=1 Tax=Phytophthora kernoviae TaxID=325452 RepID=A0A3F2RU17_9STRA|nr:hypothetical protein BBJ29_000477 [Phytophthora kernoviae]RLN63741.1 hypothetical protein BBP00_00003915 [Phytophthora kernoviae]
MLAHEIREILVAFLFELKSIDGAYEQLAMKSDRFWAVLTLPLKIAPLFQGVSSLAICGHEAAARDAMKLVNLYADEYTASQVRKRGKLPIVLGELEVMRLSCSLGMLSSVNPKDFEMEMLEAREFDEDFALFLRKRVFAMDKRDQGGDIAILSLFGKQEGIKHELKRLKFWSADMERELKVDDQGIYSVSLSQSEERNLRLDFDYQQEKFCNEFLEASGRWPEAELKTIEGMLAQSLLNVHDQTKDQCAADEMERGETALVSPNEISSGSDKSGELFAFSIEDFRSIPASSADPITVPSQGLSAQCFGDTLFILDPNAKRIHVLRLEVTVRSLGSFERTEQEDIFLSVLNASVSMFTVFRMEMRYDKEIDDLFARFQKGVALIKGDPSLFRGKLYMSVKDVNPNDQKGVLDEFVTKVQKLVGANKESNFLLDLYSGQLDINCSPPLGTIGYYQSLMHAQNFVENSLGGDKDMGFRTVTSEKHHLALGKLVTKADAEEIDVEERKYKTGERGIAEMCNLYCSKMGREHVHYVDCDQGSTAKCVYSGSTTDQRRHCTRALDPKPEKETDEILHEQFWKTLGWEDPCTSKLELELFGKCGYKCDAPIHDDKPSYCILPAWHTPEPKPSSGFDGFTYVSGHKFECSHVASSGKIHHVFVLDCSGSMSGRPWDDLLAAVREYIYNRIADGGSLDLVSIVTFDTSSQIVYEAQNITTLTKAGIPYRGGGTTYAAGLRAASEVLSRVNFDVYKPAVVFFSDGQPFDPLPGEQLALHIKACYQKYGLLAFAVGFGRINLSILERVAQKMGGAYHQVLTGNELKTTFFSISASLSSRAGLALANPVHERNCVICGQDLASEETVNLKPCDHELHTECLEVLVRNAEQDGECARCPSCRCKISS